MSEITIGTTTVAGAEAADGFVRVCSVDDLPTVGAVQAEIAGEAEGRHRARQRR